MAINSWSISSALYDMYATATSNSMLDYTNTSRRLRDYMVASMAVDTDAYAASTYTALNFSHVTKYVPMNVSYEIPEDREAIAGTRWTLAAGRTYQLPDGAELIMDVHGNYRIEDKNAKVTYRANRSRDWSPHLNASDMMAQFVKYVGTLGVKQSEVLGLPIELFINWLIIEAAERDQDPIPADVRPIKEHKAVKAITKPRCWDCGRFIRPALFLKTKLPFCDPAHAGRYVYKRQAAFKEIPRPKERNSTKALPCPTL